MRVIFLLLTVCTLSLGIVPVDALAERRCETGCERGGECRPYGGYCRNRRQGWYGSRREVRTEEEARALLSEYFAGSRASVGSLAERETYFEADVINPLGKVIDRVIIDKRSGRIRSIY
ncbi:MAG: hypothetical protein HZC44_10020 [Geobacter sp.]|nr:hypothetical protein [Geobacter sp.]